jgi:hypothetical protein
MTQMRKFIAITHSDHQSQTLLFKGRNQFSSFIPPACPELDFELNFGFFFLSAAELGTAHAAARLLTAANVGAS